jgi:type VI secretion system secreted protein Hcp
MAIYMNYTNITGDVNSAGHENWVELGSFQWGVGRGITAADAGSNSDREGSLPSVSEIVVTKTTDSASPNLFRASCGKGPAATSQPCTIDFCTTDANNPQTYLQFQLDNTLVSGYSMSSGGDRPSESISLNFTKITMNNTPETAATDSGTTDRPFYDLSTHAGG